MSQAQAAISLGSAFQLSDGRREDWTTLIYNTKTGELIKIPREGFKLGEVSVVRMPFINEGLERRFNEAADRWDTISSGTNFLDINGTTRIATNDVYVDLSRNKDSLPKNEREKIRDMLLPDRILPGEVHSHVGVVEPWGVSKLVPDAHGDLVILKTIEEFNNKFGPKPLQKSDQS